MQQRSGLCVWTTVFRERSDFLGPTPSCKVVENRRRIPDRMAVPVRNKQQSRSRAEIQADLRQMRQESKRQLIVHKLSEVQQLRSKERVAKSLKQAGSWNQFNTMWSDLSNRIEELSDRRNEVMHSGLGFSGGKVVCQTGGILDHTATPVTEEAGRQLLSDLGKLSGLSTSAGIARARYGGRSEDAVLTLFAPAAPIIIWGVREYF
jgi:hypothetical protein